MGARSFTVVLFLLALGLFAGLAAWMRVLEHRAVAGAGVREQLDQAGRPRPIAQVAEAVRSMKLVTVEIETSARSWAWDESWRGDVTARVEAPVSLLYGTDLSRLTVDGLAWSPVSGGYVVRVPRPERIATVVRGGDEDFEVTSGWLRLRSRAGEYYLGLARRGLYEQAQKLVLSAEEAAKVREMTREQVESLVRRLVGERTPVTVVVEDEG